MKKLLIIFAAIALAALLSVGVSAASAPVATATGTLDSTTGIGDIVWTYYSDQSLVISTTSDTPVTMKPFFNGSTVVSTPWAGKTISTVYFDKGITNVPDYALYSCYPSIIKLSDTVTSVSVIGIPSYRNLVFVVDENNPAYRVDGTCLIEIESGTVIKGWYRMDYENGLYTYTCTIPDDGTVKAIGNSAFSGLNQLTEIKIPYGVTSIGDGAFSSCTGLESISIPDSIRNIGANAFSNCKGLPEILDFSNIDEIGIAAFNYAMGCKKLIIPVDTVMIYRYSYPMNETHEDYYLSVPSIFNSSTLEEVVFTYGKTGVMQNSRYNGSGACNIYSATFEDGIKNIGDFALYGCPNLTSVTIPDSVTSIGDSAFSGCAISSISVPNKVTSIGDFAFGNCRNLTSVTIPDSVTSIGDYAFGSCTALSNIYIGSGVTSIGNSAFNACQSLTNVYLPANVKTVGSNAFNECMNLESVTISNGIETLGTGAFYLCPKLTEVYIPASIKNIKGKLFNGCSALTTIEIDPTNRAYYSIGNCIVEAKSKTLIEGCNGSVLPEKCKITSIGAGAFNGYASCISNWTLSGGYLTGITSITIPDTVTTIGKSAFVGCSNMTELFVPKSVNYIDDNAFKDCSGLTKIIFAGSEEEWDQIYKGASWNSNTGAYEVAYLNQTSNLRGDLNGDGAINIMDVLRLAKFVAGWDVELY